MIEFNRQYHLAPQQSDAVKIKIVGLGGAGSNALDRIVLDGMADAELVAINTDVQALTSSVASEKVQLGRAATRGLGAGGDPEIGLAAAEEAVEEIRGSLENAGMVFLCAGLGGGTGSGAAALVTSLAKENGALVIVFATMPFAFEGRRRAAQAHEALAQLEAAADAVICFENDKMGDAVSPKASIDQAFAAADETISQSVRAIAQLFARPGILHIGFDDLRAALRGPDARCLFGHGEAEGDNRAHEALARALKNPLMDRGRLLGEAHKILVNVAGGTDLTLNEVQILMEELGRHVGDETQILFGTAVDPGMGRRMSVTLLSSIASAAALPARRAEPPKMAHENGVAAAADHHAEVEAAAEDDSAPDLLDEPMIETVKSVPVARKPTPAKAPQPEPELLPAAPAASSKSEAKQETLQFEPVTRGRFEKIEPTIVDGQDLDVPTFLRRNVRVK